MKNENAKDNDKEPNETKPKKADNGSRSVRALLGVIHETGAKLFHDQYNDTHIAHYGDGSTITKINSKVTRLWLIKYAYTYLKSVPSADTINRVVQTLSAQAYFDNAQHYLDVRSVHRANGLWYDLGD